MNSEKRLPDFCDPETNDFNGPWEDGNELKLQILGFLAHKTTHSKSLSDSLKLDLISQSIRELNF